MSQGSRPVAAGFGVALALTVVGAALLVAQLTVAGAVCLALAGVLAVSTVFLLVGLSEDRDRRRHPRG